MTNVFVYGTLKKGFRLHQCLMDTPFIGKAVTATPEYGMYGGMGVPFLYKGTHYVSGEVYSIEDLTLLARLDRLERMYDRTPIQVRLDSGEIIDASIYIAKDTPFGRKVDADENNIQHWQANSRY